MFLSQELLTDFSIRVIAAGGPHQQVPARETTMTPSTATAVMVWRSIGAAMITLMAGSMENNVPTTRADVMRPDSTAYAPPTIMFSASA